MKAVLALAAEQMIMSKLLGGSHKHVNIFGKAEKAVATISAFLVILGLGFLIYAAHLTFLQNFEPNMAAAYTGLLIIGVSLVAIISLYAIFLYKTRKIRNLKSNVFETVSGSVEELIDELAEPIKNHPKTAMAVASILGLVLADRIRDSL